MFPHVPTTRVCVTAMIVGVPVGTQRAWLSNNRSGCPFDRIRTEPMMNCAVTHGPLPAGGGGDAQPAITYGVGSVTVGIPDTITRGFTNVGCACPACEQSTVAP